MQQRRSLSEQLSWLAVGFGVPALVLGVPYMIVPYEHLEGLGVVFGWGPFVLWGTALVLAAAGRVRFWAGSLAVGSSMMAVVGLRVLVDVAQDPTSHNLWPLEFILAAVIGGGAAMFGSALGWLWLRIRGRA